MHDVVLVGMGSMEGYAELVGYFSFRLAVADEAKDFELPPGELGGGFGALPGSIPQLREGVRWDRSIEEGLSATNGEDCVDHHMGGVVLENVSGDPVLQSPLDEIQVVVHGENNGTYLGMLPVEKLGKLQAIHSRHGYVEDEDFRLRLFDAVESLSGRRRLEDDFYTFVGLLDNGLQTVTEHLMVIYETHTYLASDHRLVSASLYNCSEGCG